MLKSEIRVGGVGGIWMTSTQGVNVHDTSRVTSLSDLKLPPIMLTIAQTENDKEH